ncbi:MAG TPA: pentapeptide repeat-containing protein [Jatrophihabitans sp.]|nr:pentapeptide repeat-containing protein [Jatrophihabitans sp.]
MARRRNVELPHSPDLPEILDPAPTELLPSAMWDGVEAGGDTSAAPWVTDVYLRDSRWLRADLVGRRLSGLQCRDVEFRNCDLSGAVLADADLTRVTFESCRTSGLVLSGAVLQDVNFVECKSDGVDLRMARLRRTAWQHSSMQNADFYRAELTDVSLLDCELAGAGFEQVKIDRVALGGSAVDGMRGVRSLAGARIDQGQALVLGALLVGELGFEIGSSP